MRFILWVSAIFGCGATLLTKGYHEDAVTILVLLTICIAAEVHKPEKGTIQTCRWAMANFKWICLPLAAGASYL
jgi:hypothetical protein